MKEKEGKVAVLVYISKPIRDKLYKLVRQKYATLRGGLSAEVEAALAHWLQLHEDPAHTNAHTAVAMNPGLPRAQTAVNSIILWLQRHGFTHQFTLNEWRKACASTVGADPRTVKKYLQLAEAFGRIKRVTAAVWEIV